MRKALFQNDLGNGHVYRHSLRVLRGLVAVHDRLICFMLVWKVSASLQHLSHLLSGLTQPVLSLLQWTAELNAAITQKFFAWLVGPLEVQEAEIEYKGQKQTWKSGVKIKKCRYLEQSGCKGMCINMCKVSS